MEKKVRQCTLFHRHLLKPLPLTLVLISASTGPYDTFFSGLAGGYLVFGQRSPRTGAISSVSQQIVIYVFARVVLALAKMSIKPSSGIIPPTPGGAKLADKISYYAWPVFAATSWGTVMWVFRWHPETVQSSLRSSMKYIYQDSDHWDSLRTWIWVNQ
jgi:peroxisomal membrane protein 4